MSPANDGEQTDSEQAEWDELNRLWELDALGVNDRSGGGLGDRQPEIPEPMDPVMAELAQLQTDVAYKRATYTLRDWLSNLDLTPRERRGLEREIAGVGAVLEKLERATVQIAAFGMVGRGKSSVLNGLLGKTVFATGALHGVTQNCDRAVWELDGAIAAAEAGGIARVELIDTPGLDEINGEGRAAIATQISHQADLLLFVISGDMTQLECETLSTLRRAGKPMLLVFNKVDRFPEAARQAVYETLRDRRVRSLISPDEIVMTSAAPLVAQAIQREEDGIVGVSWQPGKPNLGELQTKIFEILRREGKGAGGIEFVALCQCHPGASVGTETHQTGDSGQQNYLAGGDRQKRSSSPKPHNHFGFGGQCGDRCHGHSVPIPALQHSHGQNRGAAELLRKIAIALGGISAGEVAANLGLSSLKGLLGISTVATGGATLLPYVSVAVTQGAIAGVSSYAIGQVAKAYLAKGGSWGDDGPRALVQTILANLDEAALTKRIEGELRQRLLRQRPSG